MNILIQKTNHIQGNMIIPSSKSLNIRAMIMALLAKGKTVIHNALYCEDTQNALDVCAAFGAKITTKQNTLIIESHGLNTANNLIFTGNSGITTLFTLPLLGLCNNASIIEFDCGTQMRARPIEPLVTALNQLGMTIEAEHFPLKVSGKLRGGNVTIDGSSSQYLSALLISLPSAENNSVIHVNHLCERPYVEMTLQCLKQHGIEIIHQKNQTTDIFIIEGNQHFKALTHQLSGDFSSAASFIAAGVLLPGEITLSPFDFNDRQGDQAIISLLQEMGADIQIHASSIKICGGKPLQGITIDANNIPDLLPTLAVIATQATSKTKIYNVAHARIKETDRIRAMTMGLRKMGIVIEEHEDGMTIHPGKLQGNFIDGFNDHRTVMAFCIAGMLADDFTIISHGDAIQKTFPDFLKILQSLKVNIQTLDNKHCFLIGFKHAGKTTIGKKIASYLNRNFIDLDQVIESTHGPCREIMTKHGKAYFRALESKTLASIMTNEPSIIALGGGTVLSNENQLLIKEHPIFHVKSEKNTVFERILKNGIPAFFEPHEDPYISFNRLWEERMPIYESVTTREIYND